MKVIITLKSKKICRVKFNNLGEVVITWRIKEVTDMEPSHAREIVKGVARFIKTDWGDISESDKKLNRKICGGI